MVLVQPAPLVKPPLEEMQYALLAQLDVRLVALQEQL